MKLENGNVFRQLRTLRWLSPDSYSYECLTYIHLRANCDLELKSLAAEGPLGLHRIEIEEHGVPALEQEPAQPSGERRSLISRGAIL